MLRCANAIGVQDPGTPQDPAISRFNRDRRNRHPTGEIVVLIHRQLEAMSRTPCICGPVVGHAVHSRFTQLGSHHREVS